MRKIYIVLFILVSYFGNTQNIQPDIKEYNKKINNNGISFTENKGQIYDQNYKPRPDVLYGAMVGNMAVHIKNTGVSYQLYRVDKYKEVEDPKTQQKRKEIDQQTIYRIDLNWLGANKNFTQSTDEELPGYNNYYLESCPNGALNVKSYTGVTLNNLYNGINLHYYQKEGSLKYDYIVAPHANYKQIQIQVKGANVELNKDGSLTLTTPLGKVKEGEPIVFQNNKQLKAKWVLNRNVLSFEIDNYNPNYELIIDPLTRLWGTYYGDSGYDRGLSCSTDGSENVYLTGFTDSNTGAVIATTGAHQSVGGGGTDVFLVKFNAGGLRQWGTYYGGIGGDYVESISTDGSGNIYLAGITDSNTGAVIATSGAHQSVFGGSLDAFLVKFNPSGIRQWGTYYGGTGIDNGHSCSTDASGNVYLVGKTSSVLGTIIATTGAHQSAFGGGGIDAFLVKFNASGVRQWGTYYGGSGDDCGYECCTDGSGNLYMAGYTGSIGGTFIVTSGAHQSSFGGGVIDVFLVKLTAGGVRVWGTYYGGSGTDFAYGCSTDGLANVYLAGNTGSNSGTVIATTGSHQSAYGGGTVDAFLVKFNTNGVRQWGTYYGGSGDDGGWACSTDATGNVYLAGYTDSNTGTVIASTGEHQSAYGGAGDAFLVKFNSNGLRQWGTYYGGSGTDFAYGCSTDATGNVYLAGYTSSNTGTMIATAGAHQSAYGGGTDDAFLVKFTDCATCTGINSNFTNIASNLIVYPNPSNGIFNVELQTSTPLSLTTIEVTDVLGRVVLTDKVKAGNYQLNLSNNLNGVYFVKATVDGNTKTVKIVKE